MKIIYVITGLSLGGAEKQVCQLADSFSSSGHEVLLVSLIDNIEVRPSSSKVDIVTLSLRKNPISLVRAFFKFNQLVNNFSPSVVHSHMVHANIFCRLSRIVVRFPKLITSAHSNYEGGFFRTLAYRLTDSLSDLTTNVSKDAVQAFIDSKATPENKIKVMYNGVCDDKYRFSSIDRRKIRQDLGIHNETNLILSVGRLEKAKDFPCLLLAFSQVLNDVPNSKLIIIGKGSLKNQLVKIAETLGISDRVLFLGAVESTHTWYSAADLFVSSSAWEGFGLVLAEAMLYELPVVATDSGGSREVIGNLGTIVPVGDSPALASAIINALNGRSLESEGVRSSRRAIIQKRFSSLTIMKEWLSIYSSIRQ